MTTKFALQQTTLIPLFLFSVATMICFGQSIDGKAPRAEILSGDSLEPIGISDDLDSNPIASEHNSVKLLNENTPDWVKNGLVLGEDHRFAINSSLSPSLEECREELQVKMMNEVGAYLDQHVLELTTAARIPQITQEYVEKYWVNKSQEFDNVQDRPAGSFHQLWIGLHISADQLKKVRQWEKQSIRDLRIKEVGVLSSASVALLSIISGLVGVLASREKAKLKA